MRDGINKSKERSNANNEDSDSTDSLLNNEVARRGKKRSVDTVPSTSNGNKNGEEHQNENDSPLPLQNVPTTSQGDCEQPANKKKGKGKKITPTRQLPTMYSEEEDTLEEDLNLSQNQNTLLVKNSVELVTLVRKLVAAMWKLTENVGGVKTEMAGK